MRQLKNVSGTKFLFIGVVFWICFHVFHFAFSIVPAVLYTVFSDPESLVKNLAKNLVENLAKNLARKIQNTSGRSTSEILFNPLCPVTHTIRCSVRAVNEKNFPFKRI